MSLDLNLLRIILAVHDAGSVAAAACALDMSQPGLSTALQRARTALNDPLFIRGAKRMLPTARTTGMIPSLRLILETVDRDIVQVAEFDPHSYTGELRFALTDAGEAILLPRVIADLSKHCPNAQIRSVSHNLPDLQHALERGSVDLALGFFPDLDSVVHHQQLISTHSFCCLLSADHPHRGATITRQQYLEYGHVLVEFQSRSEEILEKFMTRQGARRKVVLRTPHFMSVPAIVARTQLIATVPEGVGSSVALMRNLRVVWPDFPMPRFDSKVYWHHAMHQAPKNRWLRRTLLATLRTTASKSARAPRPRSAHEG